MPLTNEKIYIEITISTNIKTFKTIKCMKICYAYEAKLICI